MWVRVDSHRASVVVPVTSRSGAKRSPRDFSPSTMDGSMDAINIEHLHVRALDLLTSASSSTCIPVWLNGVSLSRPFRRLLLRLVLDPGFQPIFQSKNYGTKC